MLRGRRLLQNALLMIGSALTLRLISVGFQSFLSGRIGAEGMGILQLVLTVSGFAMTLGSFGTRVTTLQLVAEAQGRADPAGADSALRACLGWAMGVSGAVGLGLTLLAPAIGTTLLEDARTVPALRCLGLLLPFGCLCGVMSGCYTAWGRVRSLVAVELLERLVSIGLTLLLLLWAGADLGRVCVAIVGGSYGSAMLSGALLYGVYRRGAKARGRAGALGREVLRRSLPLALNDNLRSGLSTLEQLLIPYGLGRYSGRGDALASYGTVCGMVFPVLLFPAAILYALSDLLVPEIARCLASGSRRRLFRLADRCLRGTVLFSAGVALALWLGGGALGTRLFHSGRAGYLLRLFAPIVLFKYLDVMVDGLQKGMGQQQYLVRYNSFTNLLDVVLLYTLLPGFGIAGYLFTYVFTHLVNLFLSLRRLLLALHGNAVAPAPRMQKRTFMGRKIPRRKKTACFSAGDVL